MNRPLTDKERERVISTLKLMETGHHESLGPFTETATGKTWTNDPVPQDPTPYLGQVDGLRVVDDCRCDVPECESIFFITDEEIAEAVSRNDYPSPVAETYTEDGKMLIIFTLEDGTLTEMEII